VNGYRGVLGKCVLMSYRKGRRLEYVVRDMFRRRGWFVVRAAASKPVDLVCLKDGEVVLVDCKYGVRGVRWAELAPLLEAAERANAKPVLAIAEKRGRVKMIDVESWAAFFIKDSSSPRVRSLSTSRSESFLGALNM
jgi:Holliday junction resolvase